MVKVGDPVTYVDEVRERRAALVQHVWHQGMVNVVVVSKDATRDDQYGRQTEHATSVPRQNADNREVGRYFQEPGVDQ